MGIFGVDVSNHQSSFDFSGWDFAILKSSEGSGFKDRMFHTHLANARRAGCVVAAYHYVRTDPADYQVGNIESMVSKDVPVILDIEDGAGSDPNHWRQLIQELRERGYTVPMVYLPRWYWEKVGKPDLSGFPPIWMSWYPDYVARPREEGIKKVPVSAWAAMDGVPVLIMQFTSTPFDQNYYPGSKAELAALFNGEDDDVSAADVFNELIDVKHGDGTSHKVPFRVVVEYSELQHEINRGKISDANEKLDEILALVQGTNADVNELKRRVAELETGGVSEERIADIAVDAVKDELGD